MQAARQRPSLTINAQKASNNGSKNGELSKNASNTSLYNIQTPTTNLGPYQTPHASTSNFALFQSHQFPPETPGVGKHLNESKVSILSDDDTEMGIDNEEGDEEDEAKKMEVNSIYSDSSLNNSSILDLQDSQRANLSQITFAKGFESLLVNNYQAYIENPQITPFSGRYPPSGIVGKVSKETLKIALQQRIRIDVNNKNSVYKNNMALQVSLLQQIRQKLIELCMAVPASAGYGTGQPSQRNGSVSSLHSLSNLNIPESLNALNLSQTSPQLSPINHTFSPINSTFNNTFISENLPNGFTSSNQNIGSIHEALNNFINNNNNNNNNNNTSNNGAMRFGGNLNPPLTPVTPITAVGNNKLLSPTMEGYQRSSDLLSPFRQTFDEEKDDEKNILTKRKRDSLKLKRFGK